MKTTTILRILSVLLVIVCLIPEDAYGQRRRGRAFRFQNLPDHDVMPYHFGYTIGYSSLGYSVRPANYSDPGGHGGHEFEHILASEWAHGFHLGVLGNLRLGRFFDLRLIPTLVIAEDRNIEYYTNDYNVYIKEGLSPTLHQDIDQSLGVVQLDFPLHLKYKSVRMNNTRAYVTTGIKFSHDFSATERKDPSGADRFRTRIAHEDLHYELGVGMDHYFYYFKLGLELKASFGIRDLLREGHEQDTRYYDSIDRLNARAIMFSIFIE